MSFGLVFMLFTIYLEPRFIHSFLYFLIYDPCSNFLILKRAKSLVKCQMKKTIRIFLKNYTTFTIGDTIFPHFTISGSQRKTNHNPPPPPPQQFITFDSHNVLNNYTLHSLLKPRPILKIWAKSGLKMLKIELIRLFLLRLGCFSSIV